MVDAELYPTFNGIFRLRVDNPVEFKGSLFNAPKKITSWRFEYLPTTLVIIMAVKIRQ